MIEPSGLEPVDRSGGGGWLINHLPAILWHRRFFVIIPAVLLFLVGLVTAFVLPTLYRSTATLLVESQDLSTDIVEAPGTGQIEERIAKIREQVLSRSDIGAGTIGIAAPKSRPLPEFKEKFRNLSRI